MKLLVIYDITDDPLRGKVANRLKDYGLERVQYSSFQGELRRHELASLEKDMRKLLNDGEETDSVLLFPLCSSCFEGRHMVGAEKEMKERETGVSFY
jgi:CRISPR-associated protein Cas2